MSFVVFTCLLYSWCFFFPVFDYIFTILIEDKIIEYACLAHMFLKKNDYFDSLLYLYLPISKSTETKI